MEDAVYSRAAAKSVLPIAAVEASVLKPHLVISVQARKTSKCRSLEVGAFNRSRKVCREF